MRVHLLHRLLVYPATKDPTVEFNDFTGLATVWAVNEVTRSDPVGKRSDPVGKRSDPVGKRSDPVGKRSDPVGKRSDPVGKRSDPEVCVPGPFLLKLSLFLYENLITNNFQTKHVQFSVH
jgi:hypothetical protein